MPEITKEERKRIRTDLDAVETARDEIDKLMEPLRKADAALELVLENLLDKHSDFIAGKCCSCGKVLLYGDQGYAYADYDPVACAEHAPNWREIEEMVKSGGFEDPTTIIEEIAKRADSAAMDELVVHIL